MAEIQPSISAADTSDFPTRRSPITILSDDILSLIFEINTQEIASLDALSNHENSEIPVNIARAESQVCRRWRTLMLDLPIVWGRCISLDVLENAKSEWWEEVLRRTQHSPLWIVGRISEAESMEDFAKVTRNRFMQLLKLWERIQKIKLVIRGADMQTEIQDAFCCPAPILELFEVYLPDLERTLFLSDRPRSTPTRSLFSNNAPALKEMNVNNIAFRASSSWLANIRHINIKAACLVYVSPLQLISRLPLLETLSLQSGNRDWSTLDTMQLPTPTSCGARLPYLREIRVKFRSLANCMALLHHILPAKAFSLQADVVVRGIGGQEDTSLDRSKATPKDVIPRYISNYISAHNSTSILILAYRDRFNLLDITNLFDPDKRAFFRMKFYSGRENPSKVASVIDAFVESAKLQPRLFDTVTRLEMYLAEDNPGSIDRALRSLVYAFQSVEHLKINDGGIHLMMMLSLQPGTGLYNDAANVLLPKVQTLEMADIYDDVIRHAVDSLVTFLSQRWDMGLPIIKLDLTSIAHSLADLRVLDELDGLEVMWKSEDQIVSYICGSGNPEKLNFLTV